jgi:thiosulfate dehydrogenase [quinone] large subunit
VGGAATFSNPLSQQTGIVIQPTAGDFRAFDALCPHAGCVVSYSKPADLLVCPCHGSQFNAKSGVVEVGPAVTGLKEYKLAVGSDGQLYISA